MAQFYNTSNLKTVGILQQVFEAWFVARDDLFSGVHLLEDETFLWHNGRFLH